MRAEDAQIEAYRRARRRFARATRLADSCFTGLWLGRLDRDALARLDERFYDEVREELEQGSGTYFDEAYNRRGLEEWELQALSEHFRGHGRVVVTGAGGGREVLALLERGFDAVGYEPHPGLVAAGTALLERDGHPGRLRHSERDVFPSGTGPADGVVVGWTSYALIPGRARRIAFLRGAHQALDRGGGLLLSFPVRSSDDAHLRVVARTASLVRRLRRAEPVEPGDALRPNFLHAFTRDELEAELREGGFELVRFAAEPYGHAVAKAA